MKDMMKTASTNAVKLLVNKNAEVTVNFTSKTSSNRVDGKTILSGVKNIIAVVS
jgi:ATP-binding protein involved in chromosome partitioning